MRRESIEMQSRNADLTIVQLSLRTTKAAQTCPAVKVSAVFCSQLRRFVAATVDHLKKQTLNGVPLFEALMMTTLCALGQCSPALQELQVAELAFKAAL